MKEEVAKNTLPYLVHYLKCSSVLDKVPLQKASRICADLPSMLFAADGELIKARCCVPMVRMFFISYLGLIKFDWRCVVPFYDVTKLAEFFYEVKI